MLVLTSQVKVSEDARLVINAGKTIGVQSIKSGKNNQTLQTMAENAAKFQADRCCQGHFNWEGRFHWLERNLPEFNDFQEVCAESWPHNNQQEAAFEMFKSWRSSPGHWRAVHSNCHAYGYAMKKGRNGIFYGVGIFARRRR